MTRRPIFDDEHEQFREQVRRFCEREIAPHYRDWEKAGITPRGFWRKAGEAGVLCTTIPAEYGGGGGTFLHACVVTEEMARVGASLGIPVHSDMVAPYLMAQQLPGDPAYTLFPYAAPTAGLTSFAEFVESLPWQAYERVVNVHDLVPLAWSNLAVSRELFPPPGPAATVAVRRAKSAQDTARQPPSRQKRSIGRPGRCRARSNSMAGKLFQGVSTRAMCVPGLPAAARRLGPARARHISGA